MRDAESRFADSTQSAGPRRSSLGGRSANLVSSVGIGRSGAPSLGRLVARFAILAGLLLAFASAATPAGAVEHLTINGEYGKEGPKATGLGSGCHLAYQAENHRLYLSSDTKIYGLNRTAPGSVSPLPGFPFSAVGSNCGDPDMEVDNSATASKNNLYAVTSGNSMYGWNSSGAALASPWPVTAGSGETCGVAVTNTGEVWGGEYSSQEVKKFTAAGAANGSIPIGYAFCKIAIDQTNNDLYVAPYNSGAIVKYTAASGYTTTKIFPASGSNNPGLAVNGLQKRLYVGNGTTQLKAYDTETAAPVETITLPAAGGQGIAVDEATDTIFVTVGSGNSGYIAEYLGVKLPKVTTGEPTANKEVSGTADPDGAGDITECFFEFGTTTFYGSTQNCAESLPITSAQTVHAVLPGVSNETTYHYRLVLSRGTPETVAKGADKIITPHVVDFLRTGPATSITRSSAKLEGSFNGTSLDTHYYFEYGTTTSYGSKEPISAPPGNDAGITSGNTPLSVNISGLNAVTVYHYRVVASNINGSSLGEDRTFETIKAIKELHTEPATNVVVTAATLNGEIDPDNLATTFYFEYGKSTAYGKTVPAPPGDSVGTTAPGLTPVSKEVTGLKPNTTYHFRVVGANVAGSTAATDDQSFTTPQPPSVGGVLSKEITAQSAELEGKVNPNSEETTYYFEYGTSPEYGFTTPVGTLAAGTTPQTVAANLSSLEGAVYHFRLVAESKWGKTVSADQTFNFYPEPCPNAIARQQTGSGHLPDCRAYELVSPGEAGTVNLFAAGAPTPRASNPPRIMIAGNFGTLEGVNAGNFLFDPYVSTRTSSGWETHYVGIPAEIAGGSAGMPGLHAGQLNGAAMADENLNHILQWRFGAPSISGEFFYVGTRHFSPYVHGPYGEDLGRYPTNLAEVPNADNPIEFGIFFALIDSPTNGWTGDQEISDGGTHYLFSTNRYEFAEGGRVERDAGPGSIYDNNLQTGTVTVASKLPGSLGGGDIPAESTVPNHFIEIYSSSPDGSHILIGAPSQCNTEYEYAYYFCAETFKYATAHLYMRVDDLNTFDVSQGHRVNFQGMTADGETVYFTSAEQLTPDDHDTSIDLYKWSEETDEITRVSVSAEGLGIGDTDACSASWISKCGVEVVPAVSGSYNEGEAALFLSKATDNSVARESGDVYFYSPEQLVDSNALPNARNLYVARGNGQVEYVATLESANSKRINRIQVTPNGSHAAFMTASPLTNYNNAGQEMLYVYDAETQTMTCASCLPNGEPPPVRPKPFLEKVQVSLNGLFLSDDGRAFWSTPDALVPRDTNGENDIYEYSGGHPQLITTGIGEKVARYEFCCLENFFGKTGTLAVALVGVSADGVDVYFTTNETLVAQDHNGAFQKIYDARTNGGFPLAAEVAPCKAADECHGATVAPPISPNVTSGADLGAGGNLEASRPKRHHKKHKRHKKHNARHQQRAGK